jgi:hypothetical protein
VRRVLLSALLLLPAAGAAALGVETNGTTAADFLTLGVGARAIAMGGAYSAVTDDAASLYWNPAGLTEIRRRSVTFMHAAYLGTSYFDYASYGQSLGRYGAIAAGLQYFSAGSLAQTDASGTSLGGLTPYDLALSLGYAYKASGSSWEALDGFSVGAAAKFIESKIVSTARTEALDLGFRSPAFFDSRLRAAGTLTNLGGTLKFDQAAENLPTTLRLGAAYAIRKPWLASVDVVLPRGGSPYVGVGTEYVLFQDAAWSFSGRAGFNSQTFQAVEGITGPSFGFGCGYRGASVDYVFVPLGALGQSHRISLSDRF